MHRHLIAVKVRVEGRADQRVQLNGFSFDQNGLKGLYTEPVQCRSAVQQHRVFLDHFVERVPDLRYFPLHHFLRALDGGNKSLLFQSEINKRLEELERHLFGQTALMQPQIRTDGNNGAAGIIHAFAKQVLPKSALFALECVAQ